MTAHSMAQNQSDANLEKPGDPIVIVGAGPVGLTLALDLAKRGVRSIVLESRDAEAPAHPKCNTVSARSMEIFRSLGVSQKVRKTGLPDDYPCDVVYAVRHTNKELGRLPIPSWSERFSSGGHDAGWPTDEPPHRISQLYLEPILRDEAANTPEIDLRYSTELVSLSQTKDNVELTCRDLASGEKIQLIARYVAGCDGGRSIVRKQINVPLEGDDALGQVKSVYFRSSDLRQKEQLAPAWMTWVVNAEQLGTIIALDGKELYLGHCRVPPEQSLEAFDYKAGLRNLIGTDIKTEIYAVEDWVARRLVASKYKIGRVFLAGDAAHQWLPFAGFGMNAGIEDATDLSWRLAAIVKGWAQPELLDSYEIERKPVGEQVSRAAKHLAENQLPPEIPPTLEADTGEGAELRAFVGAALVERDGAQFNPIGMNFGISYEKSPAIIYDGEEAPGFEIDTYTPSTVPGCRAPYFRYANGVSLYDRLGSEFTLLRRDANQDVSAFEAAAAQCGMPLDVLDLDEEGAALYDRALVIVRPDQRVAWRGGAVPADLSSLFDKLRGAPS